MRLKKGYKKISVQVYTFNVLNMFFLYETWKEKLQMFTLYYISDTLYCVN